jgi:arylsulfatase A-like enzyme
MVIRWLRWSLVLATLVAAQSVRAQPQPDILFIVIDDLNDWVGVLGGHPQTKTPNIDRLAARGLTFLNAHTPSAMCNPARTALLSGLLPSTTGVYGNGPDWRRLEQFSGITTLPRFFREHGYRTFGAGKIFHAHTFGASGFTGYNDPNGWDAFYPSIERQLPDEVGPPRRPANGNDLFRSFDWSPVYVDDRAMGDGQVVAWVERQLAADAGAPRFVAAGIYRPHLPWYVPPRYFEMHPVEQVELPPYIDNDLDDIPPAGAASRFDSIEWHEWILANDQWEAAVGAYLASVSFADAMVGRLLDALDESGRADDTIIVLFSDHGFHLGEKYRWRKSTLWQESTHVPLIVVAPGVTTPGSRSPRPVSTMDIYPTLAELAGLTVPSHVQGRSLVPLLEEPDAQWDHPVLSTFDFGNHAIITEDYRYIRYEDGSEELYDRAADPNEWHNLAGDARYRSVVRELAHSLPAVDAPPVDQPRR